MVPFLEDWPGRTKTSSAGTPFGAVAAGFLSTGTYNWLYKFFDNFGRRCLTQYGSADIDFMLPSIGPSGLRCSIAAHELRRGAVFLAQIPVSSMETKASFSRNFTEFVYDTWSQINIDFLGHTIGFVRRTQEASGKAPSSEFIHQTLQSG